MILTSIFFNYLAGLALASIPGSKRKARKTVLWAGIAFNLLLLCYYKYSDFLIVNLNWAFGLNWNLLKIDLPLGISFFTFTQIAFLVDTYYSEARETNGKNYTLFVTFFPHLLAGPIVHHRAVMPQFDRLRSHIPQSKNIFLGLFYFLIGLFQKVVIADSVARIANAGFLNAHLLSLVESWMAVLSYTLQIYFDFAGYSNMAIGLALFFNIRFPVNFNSPYQAVSIIEFWRRWHMTLSQFLRDYLYIPLGGNRCGEWMRYRNIFLTMLLGGIWHGAGWTFALWGAYHGFLIVLNHLAEKWKLIRLPKFISVLVTFLLVGYGWVLFRATDLSQVQALTRGLFGLQGIRFSNFPFFWSHDLILVAALCCVAWFWPNAEFWVKKLKPNVVCFFLFLGLVIINILFLNRDSAFLYFQF